MLAYLFRRFQALDADEALRRYAALAALVHPLTAWAWLDPSVGLPVPEVLAPGALAICWPFFPTCGQLRVLPSPLWRWLIVGYGALGVVAATLWIGRRWRPAGLVQLALEAFKVAVVVQDYRLRLNEHYMALFAAIALLLMPAPRDLVRLILVAFYLAAGLLKLTPDWLSGQALPTLPLLIPAALASPAACFVVLLELLLVWGLLMRAPAAFWGTLGLLTLFHVSSYGVVGYFYPLLMGLLLSLFVLVRPAEAVEPASLLRRLARRELPRSSYTYLGIFVLLQVAPRLYPGDTAITGEGRWLGLHMFDARIVCRAFLRAHRPDGRVENRPLPLIEAVRIRCDPLVLRATAAQACSQLPSESLDLVVDSRHVTESDFRRIIDQPRFCPDVPAYRPFAHNDWIHLAGS